MAKVHEITIWTRGVTMDKEGRDIATAIGDAAHKEGKHVQFFDNYEDLPDRVLVTTRKYVRISDEEIEREIAAVRRARARRNAGNTPDTPRSSRRPPGPPPSSSPPRP